MKKLLPDEKNKLIKALLIAGIIIVSGAWLFYSWYYQSLPQAAIYVLNSVPTPTAGENILVFSPHPDDETIAAGGYIAASEKAGAHVWIALVTNGNKHGLEYSRYDEFIKATGALGVTPDHLFFLGYPDGGLYKVNQTSFRNNLQNIIGEVNPQVIIAPDPLDYNLDHATIGKAVAAITSGKGKTIYYYFVHYPHFPIPQNYAPRMYVLPPLRLVNASENWMKFVLPPGVEDIKRNAVLEYKSQLGNPFLQSLLLGMVRKNELFVVVNHS